MPGRSLIVASALLIVSCSKSPARAPQGEATSGAGTAQVQQQAAQQAEEYDTGGTFEARISGAIAAAVRAKDASYCDKVTSVGAAAPMHMFAMSLVEKSFSVLVNGTNQPLKLGKFPVTAPSGKGFTAMVVDKRAGQVVYEATGGDLTIMRVDPDRVAGIYHLLATQKGGTAKITADGSFDVTRARGCQN